MEILHAHRFIQAIRDSGYRNFESALSELIDNSFQASASTVQIFLTESDSVSSDRTVAVLDDGEGMSYARLRSALQFGGTHRFNDRNGIGRYGMGLPCSSLSQARRVDVYTWQSPSTVLHAFLDLDELLSLDHPDFTEPASAALPPPFGAEASPSGTLVIWSKLDRTKPVLWRSLPKRLDHRIGQRFRYFLWENRRIQINGSPVVPFDPLYLESRTRTPWIGATPYGSPLEFTLKVDPDSSAARPIQVQFTELPVDPLAGWGNEEKRQWGIVGGAGVSIIRAGREIDYGWHFIGKRRENYDDWWRCEIRFPPELDELFGVSHTKQGIRPSEDLRGILAGEIGSIARTLNRRVRSAHLDFGGGRRQEEAARIATEKGILLRPISMPSGASSLAPQYPAPKPPASDHTFYGDSPGTPKYKRAVEEFDGMSFFEAFVRDGQATLVLDPRHEFYRRFFARLEETRLSSPGSLKRQVELILFALGHADLLEWEPHERGVIRRFVAEWSRALSVFLGGA